MKKHMHEPLEHFLSLNLCSHYQKKCMAESSKQSALTMTGSCDLETQHVMSFRVSFLTVLMPAMRGCFVTSSPAINTDQSVCSYSKSVCLLTSGGMVLVEISN